jgi:threonine/homoserine/homoserine lactone efflux protein
MLTFDFIGYILFAFVRSITPGPKSYLLLANGKNYGYKDSVMLIAGIAGILHVFYKQQYVSGRKNGLNKF